jgi:hypothetical protein
VIKKRPHLLQGLNDCIVRRGQMSPHTLPEQPPFPLRRAGSPTYRVVSSDVIPNLEIQVKNKLWTQSKGGGVQTLNTPRRISGGQRGTGLGIPQSTLLIIPTIIRGLCNGAHLTPHYHGTQPHPSPTTKCTRQLQDVWAYHT